MRKYKPIALRVPQLIRQFIIDEAEKQNRSLNKQLEFWVKEKMKQSEAESQK